MSTQTARTMLLFAIVANLGTLSSAIAAAEAGVSADNAILTTTTPPINPAPDINELRKLRDPFKRPFMANRIEKARTELESIPLSDFVMVGVLTGPKKTRAILRVGSGKVYVVSDGVHIGTRNGYIRKILDDRVIVNESSVDALGEKELLTSEIRLASERKTGTEPDAPKSPIAMPMADMKSLAPELPAASAMTPSESVNRALEQMKSSAKAMEGQSKGT